jgi:hypothetical protein
MKTCRSCYNCRKIHGQYRCVERNYVPTRLDDTCPDPDLYYACSGEGLTGEALYKPLVMKRCTLCGTQYPQTKEFWHILSVRKGDRRYQYLRPECKPCRKAIRHEYWVNRQKRKKIIDRGECV